MLRRTFAVLFAIAILAPAVHVSAAPAGGTEYDRADDRHGDRRGQGHDGRHRRRSIPEFDPATAGAIAAIVAGGVVLVARRRKR